MEKHTICLLQSCCHGFLNSFLLTGSIRKSAAPFNMHFTVMLIESLDVITAGLSGNLCLFSFSNGEISVQKVQGAERFYKTH